MISLAKSLSVVGFMAVVDSCSNIIVSPGASMDSSSMVAYNADSGSLFGSLYYYPAADYENGYSPTTMKYFE